MNKKKILFICGSLNQTTMLHKISLCLPEYEHFFSAFYCDGIERIAAKLGLLDFSVLGGAFRKQTEKYFTENNLSTDYEGKKNSYDVVVICSDLIVPKNIRDRKLIMVQEGMTDPENIFFHLAKKLKTPRYFAGTAATGISDMYDVFCVASEGYRQHFARKGAKPEKMIVTGIPNFDNCSQYLENDFPYKDYALVCSSDSRETFKYENRKKFILDAVRLSEGRKIIFKLHPNENYSRAKKEILKWAPGSQIYLDGNTNEMIANCSVLITMFSTVVYVGLALGKRVHSAFDIAELRRLLPVQNGGTSASLIADICRKFAENEAEAATDIKISGFNERENVTFKTA